ncbi:UNVERIFIED_CONTAM: hypothetical protein ABIE34_000403 [Jeotgalibacillus campisalis]
MCGNSNTGPKTFASSPTSARNSTKPGFTARNAAQLDATGGNTKWHTSGGAGEQRTSTTRRRAFRP